MDARVRWLAWILAGWVMLLAGGAAAQFPAPPSDGSLVADFTGILSPDARARITTLQREALERHETPIVVVTIGSTAQYVGTPRSIEAFATGLFNHWQIGHRRADGTLANKGVLLLISLGDRAARIELGGDWGRAADGRAREIMDGAIVPRFKAGDFAGGIIGGVERLAALAADGPEALGAVPTRAETPSSSGPSTSSAPPAGFSSGSADLGAGRSPASPMIPASVMLPLLAIGAACIVGSFFAPDGLRKPLLYIGIACIVAPFCFWVVLLVLLFSGRFGGGGRRGGMISFGGGGGSSFGSGGSSGGGGASGSW